MDKNNNMPPMANNIPSEAKYAQIVSVVANPYDTTLVFFQLEPRLMGGEGHNFIPFQKEVARVIVPTKSAHDLAGLLKQVFSDEKMKTGIDSVGQK